MPASKSVIEAAWTWTGEQFQRDVQIVVDRHGRIEKLIPAGRPATRRLPGQALLPGFVNARSLSFQRGMRGRGEGFPVGVGNLWTWREAMYDLVLELDSTSLYALASRAFREMRAAGITTVGEVQLLHHTLGEVDYAYDEVILRAAATSGIRIALLEAYVHDGGYGLPPNDAQKRFASPSRGQFWRQVDALEAARDPRTQSIGVAAYGLRTVPLVELAELHAETRRRDLVFHVPAEEQRHDVDQCVAHYGKRPLELLLDTIKIDRRVTVAHATHATPDDLARFFAAGGNVCLAPLTEHNLGDGLIHTESIRGVSEHLALGTAGNGRISMLEEMRALEYAHRVRAESRGIFRDESGRVSKTLLEIATRGGARALGLETGRIYPGYWADFTAIDLTHPSIEGCDEQSILDAVVLGAGDEIITATCVGGKWTEHREARLQT
ncbi:MAG: amidohydrolase family protein [Acidobacteria bacterium]|nr:amidohydrolase family protein [Acidobacteriota bacterium]